MTTEYRDLELKEAEAQRDAAREHLNSAKTKKALREADENLQFWSSRVANLSQAL